MRINKALRQYKDASGIGTTEIGRAIGRTPQSVNDILKRPDPKVSNACGIAQGIGCELVLRKIGERDGIIITADD